MAVFRPYIVSFLYPLFGVRQMTLKDKFYDNTRKLKLVAAKYGLQYE